jgi:transposase|tara:strand:+ start:96 stop:1118 length:1023 start_codon:yes stop_codon:yes gene_type:complete
MKNFLTIEQKNELLNQHKKEKDKKIGDRIKAIILSNEGWTYRLISEALLIDEETVSRHVQEYKEKEKLKGGAGGSKSNLTTEQSNELAKHIEESLYLDSKNIRGYIEQKYGIKYSSSGILSWLHNNGFSYKKPDRIPAKADREKQAEFITNYKKLKSNLEKDDVILFGDGVHPSMETKITYGWIRTGKFKEIKTTASRTRVNLLGVINLNDMDLITKSYKTIDSDSVIDLLKDIKVKYSDKKNIYFIVDNGSYYTSKAVKEKASQLGITMTYLPPYSPNLNPIERLWKYMNEKVRNNRFFSSAKEFRESILSFFKDDWHTLSTGLETRINDNFQILKSAI